MALIPKPKKPLKVLTIDGGGLQAISTLLILNKLMCNIQERNNADEIPRPCDVFDVIGGLGAGGWLALFLGRFKMDIASCLTEWYSLVRYITPKTKGQTLRRRLFRDSYFDTPSLIRRVDDLAELYGVGHELHDSRRDAARCRYVFVAAKRAETNSYNLFRTYDVPETPKLKHGATDPKHYKMSSAFAVTGAARHFTPSHKETIGGNGRIPFLDSHFPEPHNVTELALEELWALFGDDVDLSVVVNIGPGMPNGPDIRQLAKRFSWGLEASPACSDSSSSTIDDEPSRLNDTTSEAPTSQSPVRRYSNKPRDRRLATMESELETNIKRKLREHYDGDDSAYFRLAPEQSPPGTTQNDARAPDVALSATKKYLARSRVRSDLDSASIKLSDRSSSVEIRSLTSATVASSSHSASVPV